MGIEFKILKHLATISKEYDGTKEINIISWNHRPAKYDIRKWDSAGSPGKGITLTEEEYNELANVIRNYIPNLESVFNEIRQIEWIEEYENGFAIDGEFFNITDMSSDFDIVEDNNLLTLSIYIDIPFCQIKAIEAVNTANSINQWFYENELLLKSFVACDENNHKFLVVQGHDVIDSSEKIQEYKNVIEDLFDTFQDELKEICFEETLEDILKKCQANLVEAQENCVRVSSTEDEEDEYEDEEDEYDEDGLYRVQFYDFIVIGDSVSCVHENHKTIEITAAVDFLDMTGTVTTITTNAYYCEQCGVFYIRRYDYNLLIAKAGKKKILCQIIKEEKYWNNPECIYYDLKDESILHKLGYHLSDDMSDKMRRQILVATMKNGIQTKEQIVNFLTYQIKLKRNNPRMQKSVKLWEEDREYVINCDVEAKKVIKPSRIKVTEFIK